MATGKSTVLSRYWTSGTSTDLWRCIATFWIIETLSLRHHKHVSHSIKMMTVKNIHLLLLCLERWYLALHHNWDIDDPASVLDLWDLHGLLHFRITSTCHASQRPRPPPHPRTASGSISTVVWTSWMIGTVSAQRVHLIELPLLCLLNKNIGLLFTVFQLKSLWSSESLSEVRGNLFSLAQINGTSIDSSTNCASGTITLV